MTRTCRAPDTPARRCSSTSQGRFVVRAVPACTGPATPKHAASSPGPGPRSRKTPTIASNEGYSALRKVASTTRRRPSPPVSNRASTVFVPPMSPARIISRAAPSSAARRARGGLLEHLPGSAHDVLGGEAELRLELLQRGGGAERAHPEDPARRADVV